MGWKLHSKIIRVEPLPMETPQTPERKQAYILPDHPASPQWFVCIIEKEREWMNEWMERNCLCEATVGFCVHSSHWRPEANRMLTVESQCLLKGIWRLPLLLSWQPAFWKPTRTWPRCPWSKPSCDSSRHGNLYLNSASPTTLSGDYNVCLPLTFCSILSGFLGIQFILIWSRI